MSTATPLSWPVLASRENADITFASFFENAPIAIARCNREGAIVEMNPAFERRLDGSIVCGGSVQLHELVRPQDRDAADSLLLDLVDGRRDMVEIPVRAGDHQTATKLRGWRQGGFPGDPAFIWLIAEDRLEDQCSDSAESLFQSDRWEAIGRLTGGVVHDFNNLLTGIMLYCDLLLSSLDSRDCRRRYADEIRTAIVQAGSLVRQLLVFARPQEAPAHPLSLNEVTESMRDLLSRLIGENIALDLELDPQLAPVKLSRSQAQQILLNLVLNARDALAAGGRVTIETSNCAFQPLAAAAPADASGFPCVLLAVRDNGHGMSAETRRRLFEPFFTTRTASKNSGLGLTTVRSIVSSNDGLIHFESEPGCGTGAMILFPQAHRSGDATRAGSISPNLELTSPRAPQEVKKESIL